MNRPHKKDDRIRVNVFFKCLITSASVNEYPTLPNKRMQRTPLARLVNLGAIFRRCASPNRVSFNRGSPAAPLIARVG
jgi:hypothetical protein